VSLPISRCVGMQLRESQMAGARSTGLSSLTIWRPGKGRLFTVVWLCLCCMHGVMSVRLRVLCDADSLWFWGQK
jgi:hypothetical protein